MAVSERMTGAQRPLPGEPFWIVHGPGVDDFVVGADLCPRQIEEMLWEILSAAGFEQIVFSDFRKTVYFRDAVSRALTRKEPIETAMPRPRATSGFAGPLGNTMLLERPATTPQRPTGSARQRTVADDAHQLMMLDGLMKESTPRTAVVIPGAGTWLPNIAPNTQRAAAETFRRWSSANHPAHGNVCVLLFAQSDFTTIVDMVRRTGYLDQLAHRFEESYAHRRASVISTIGFADERELGRLVQYLRLTAGLEIADWTTLGQTLRVMAAQRHTVRTWQVKLSQLAQEGTELTSEALDVDASRVPAARDIWQTLDGMVGMRSVKNYLEGHRAALDSGVVLRDAGRGDGDEPMVLHLVFSGGPGTGKTVVARLIGELYRDMGLLSRGHIVEVAVEELVSPYINDSAERTGAAVRRALGGVLFIDEAYQLRGEHGTQAIDRLVAELENHRDDLAVIIAGYPDRMTELLATNLGLASRFPDDNRIAFPDFAPEELHTILLQRLETGIGLTCTPELVDALETLTFNLHRTRSESFGNARDMRELAASIRRNWAQRNNPIDPADIPPATIEDIPADKHRYLAAAAPLEQVLAELTPMIGLASVKTALRELASVLQLRRDQPHRTSPVIAPHMLFLGSPGTGKTTVATLVGRALVALGLLVKGDVVSVTATDLIAGYVGQTGTKTREVIESALDGVLFIDEAYALVGHGSNDFGRQSVAELIKWMEAYRGRLVVIAAGYQGPMEEFLSTNPGLRSRFSERLEFADYSRSELEQIFESIVRDEGYDIADGVLSRAGDWLEVRRITEGAHFGNGRTVRNLFDKVERRVASRVAALPTEQRAAHSTLILPVDLAELR
ncbi:AAA family ATPase [Nocardia sp. NPDC058705]|uniref:AAA family ATPase n=1 Tax=Nocardia sp. NPDC058705 TaxID=3346609 RepID=UPI0036AE5A56